MASIFKGADSFFFFPPDHFEVKFELHRVVFESPAVPWILPKLCGTESVFRGVRVTSSGVECFIG